MESNASILRRRNDAAAERELREARADTLSGLRYAITLREGQNPLLPHRGTDTIVLRDAITIIERGWPE